MEKPITIHLPVEVPAAQVSAFLAAMTGDDRDCILYAEKALRYAVAKAADVEPEPYGEGIEIGAPSASDLHALREAAQRERLTPAQNAEWDGL